MLIGLSLCARRGDHGRLTGGLFHVPAASQGLVERDHVGQAREARLENSLLRGIKVLLRGKHGEITLDAIAVTHVGQAITSLLGCDQRVFGLNLVFQRRSPRQRIRTSRNADWMVFSYCATSM